MFGMVVNSAQLFFTGKLFANNAKAFLTIALGIAVTAGLFLGALKIGLTLLPAAAATGLLGGILQPVLLRNVKYR